MPRTRTRTNERCLAIVSILVAAGLAIVACSSPAADPTRDGAADTATDGEGAAASDSATVDRALGDDSATASDSAPADGRAPSTPDAATDAVDATGPDLAALKAVMTFTRQEIADAIGVKQLLYDDEAGPKAAGEGQALNNAFMHHAPTAIALEAWTAPIDAKTGQVRRVTPAQGGAAETGRDALYRQLRGMIGDQLPADADRAPGGRGGFQMQLELNFVLMVAAARIIPEVWSRFSAAEKQRMDLVMKGELVAAAYGSSPLVPFNRTIRGYTLNATTAPNFSTPHRLLPFVIDRYLRQNGETAQQLLWSFDRDAFAKQCQAAGKLGQMVRTHKPSVLVAGATFWSAKVQAAAHGAPSPLGVGATKQQLHAALRLPDAQGTPRPYTFRKWTNPSTGQAFALADPVIDAINSEVARCFSKPIVPGVKDRDGPVGTFGSKVVIKARTGPPPWDKHKYGIRCLDSRATGGQTKGCIGKPAPPGQDTDTSAWALIPFAPGTIGLPLELDTADGGSLEPDAGPKIRSSMTYAWHGTSMVTAVLAVTVIYGEVSREVFDQAAALPQWDRGLTFTAFAMRHGWRSYAKGGMPSNSNVDTDLAWAEEKNISLYSLCGDYRDTKRTGMHRILYEALHEP